jgi:hypothetical protein
VRNRVDLQVRDAQPLGLAGRAAAQNGPHAGWQFGESEGLDQVVVGAHLEALDAVLDGVPRGQEEDRDLLAGAP